MFSHEKRSDSSRASNSLTELQSFEADKIESALSSIMTGEEYSRIEHPSPYVFELKKDDSELVYFGTPHVHNLEHPVLAQIEATFDKANPDLVFVEGIRAQGDREIFNHKIKNTTREKIIGSMGESGFTLKLAVDKGIEWQSPEPSEQDLFTGLLAEGFSKDEIFSWHVLQLLPQYADQDNKEGFKDYCQKYIQYFHENTNWQGFDYSYSHAIQEAERLLGKLIDIEHESDALNYIDPIPWDDKKSTQTVLNRIGSSASRLRDHKIIGDIAEALKVKKRIFIVYGSSHAVMQEPALKKLME